MPPNPATPKKRRRSRADWRSIIAAQETSGLSIRAFCEQHAIALNSFYKWRGELASPKARAPDT